MKEKYIVVNNGNYIAKRRVADRRQYSWSNRRTDAVTFTNRECARAVTRRYGGRIVEC
jgi:nitrous oxide reductase accessory protein NosL